MVNKIEELQSYLLRRIRLAVHLGSHKQSLHFVFLVRKPSVQFFLLSFSLDVEVGDSWVIFSLGGPDICEASIERCEGTLWSPDSSLAILLLYFPSCLLGPPTIRKRICVAVCSKQIMQFASGDITSCCSLNFRFSFYYFCSLLSELDSCLDWRVR
jgi:hypothetical protein